MAWKNLRWKIEFQAEVQVGYVSGTWQKGTPSLEEFTCNPAIKEFSQRVFWEKMSLYLGGKKMTKPHVEEKH